jgi:hypothetical protein
VSEGDCFWLMRREASEIHDAIIADDQARVTALLKTPGMINLRDGYVSRLPGGAYIRVTRHYI